MTAPVVWLVAPAENGLWEIFAGDQLKGSTRRNYDAWEALAYAERLAGTELVWRLDDDGAFTGTPAPAPAGVPGVGS